jgi:D-glycero-alpha-D-manno-heptose 1-phosphate guanylyltransferase
MTVTAAETSAIILAGGRGTRIAELYPQLPKPMIPANGQPFLHWVTAWLMAQGLRDMIYSVGYRGEVIADWIASQKLHPGARLRCVTESKPLGTGGAILHSLGQCRGAILALNGDSLALGSLQPGFERLSAEQLDAVIFATAVDDTSRYGSLAIDEKQMLLGFHEKRPGTGFINAGVYLLRSESLRDFPTGVSLSMEYDLIPGLLKKGLRVGVSPLHGAFLDIGTPETVDQATEFIRCNPECFAEFAQR